MRNNGILHIGCHSKLELIAYDKIAKLKTWRINAQDKINLLFSAIKDGQYILLSGCNLQQYIDEMQ
jgi:hydrogenase maturation factor